MKKLYIFLTLIAIVSIVVSCSDGGNQTDLEVRVSSNGEKYVVNEENETCEFIGYENNTDAKIVVPSEIDGYPVTLISGGAFSSSETVTDLIISDGIIAIDCYAFDGCVNLKSITIPSSVTSIGAGAFRGCENLKSVYLSDIAAWCNTHLGLFNPFEIESILIMEANSPFYYGADLYLSGEIVRELVIPADVTTISMAAFAGCASIETLRVSKGVTQIGQYAFDNCSNLKNVYIPDTVTNIDKFTFHDCTSLASLYITDVSAWVKADIQSNPLGYGADLYLNGELLTDLVIPSDIAVVENDSFRGCTSIVSVTIPDGVSAIDEQAFTGCTNLTKVEIPESVDRVGSYVFFRCENLTVHCRTQSPRPEWDDLWNVVAGTFDENNMLQERTDCLVVWGYQD